MRRYASKIEAAAARRKGLGSLGDLGPGALAEGEWTALGLERPDVPPAVVINEALELARTFSSPDAVRFVNGVLDAIRKRLDSDRKPGTGRREPGAPPR